MVSLAKILYTYGCVGVLMRLVLVVVLALLVACAPVDEVTVEPVEPAPQPAPEPEPRDEAPPVADVADVAEPEVEEEVKPYGPYSDIGCESLFELADFARVCGVDGPSLSKTYRAGTKNCYVSVRHKQDRLSHAAINSVKFDSAEEAREEFERRLQVRLAGASDKTIEGARTYEFAEINRHNIEFVKGQHIVTVGSSVSLCPEDRLMEIANLVAPNFR